MARTFTEISFADSDFGAGQIPGTRCHSFDGSTLHKQIKPSSPVECLPPIILSHTTPWQAMLFNRCCWICMAARFWIDDGPAPPESESQETRPKPPLPINAEWPDRRSLGAPEAACPSLAKSRSPPRCAFWNLPLSVGDRSAVGRPTTDE